MITFNSGRAERRLRTIQRRVETQKDRVFRIPLNETLRSVRNIIRSDSIPTQNGPVQGDHIGTGNLLRNTRIEVRNETPESIILDIGFFVPYGLNLEFGSEPHTPDFNRLVQWAIAKGFDNPTAAAARISRKIQQDGTFPYQIITGIWENTREDYVEESLRRFTRLFD